MQCIVYLRCVARSTVMHAAVNQSTDLGKSCLAFSSRYASGDKLQGQRAEHASKETHSHTSRTLIANNLEELVPRNKKYSSSLQRRAGHSQPGTSRGPNPCILMAKKADSFTAKRGADQAAESAAPAPAAAVTLVCCGVHMLMWRTCT